MNRPAWMIDSPWYDRSIAEYPSGYWMCLRCQGTSYEFIRDSDGVLRSYDCPECNSGLVTTERRKEQEGGLVNKES